jgi:hypothetical protein
MTQSEMLIVAWILGLMVIGIWIGSVLIKLGDIKSRLKRIEQAVTKERER